MSGYMDKVGVEVTLIYSGDKKIDGNPYESLPDDVKDDIQSRIDSTRQLFVKTVARNRNMSVESVLATEAGTYSGQAAVDVGFADKIMSFNEVLADMNKRVTSSDTTGGQMAENNTKSVVDKKENGDSLDTEGHDVDNAVSNVSDSNFGALEVTAMCSENKMTHLIPALVSSGATESQVKEKIEDVKDLRNVLTADGYSKDAISKIEQSTSMASLARNLIAEQASDEDINPNVPETGDGDALADHDFYGYEKK